MMIKEDDDKEHDDKEDDDIEDEKKLVRIQVEAVLGFKEQIKPTQHAMHNVSIFHIRTFALHFVDAVFVM